MTTDINSPADTPPSASMNPAAAIDAPWPSPLRAWYAVGILFVAYALSFVDRSILTLLVGPIRADLQISDTQVSLLHGFAFAIFYTLLGIPIARIADTGSRRGIIAASAIAWSIACAGCGLARHFLQLFVGRIGVGVGEAGLSPAAYSMLADLFPANRLGLAMSAYTSAIYVGAGSSLIIGGAVISATAHWPSPTLPFYGAVHPWQITFMLVGLPGIPLGALLWTVREPARRLGGAATTGPQEYLPPPSGPGRSTFSHLRSHKAAYASYILGFTLISVIYNVAVAWAPAYLTRRLGIAISDAGYHLGVVILSAGVLGVILGGILTDALRKRGRLDATLTVGIVSALLTAPSGTVAFRMTALAPFLALFAIMLFGASMAFGAAAAGIQALTPNRMRAQASAVYLFTLNMLAVGLGPTAAALLTDHWYHDDQRVGSSVAIVIGVAAPLAFFFLLGARRPFLACASSISGSPDG